MSIYLQSVLNLNATQLYHHIQMVLILISILSFNYKVLQLTKNIADSFA